jgi:DNA adenine methylase
MNSLLRWVGGKNSRAKMLIKMFPDEYQAYVEVFGGAGNVLFSKPPSKKEILNDFDGDLVNFWKQVKENHTSLIESFKYILISRQTFDEYAAKLNNSDYKDDLERAHIYYYINRLTHAGDMKYPKYSKDRKESKRLDLLLLEQNVNQAYDRLVKVEIERLHFKDIITGYDDNKNFFFLDPPYRNKKKYRVSMCEEDYKTLAELCKNLKGKFLMTINDDDFIRELFFHESFFIYAQKVKNHVNDQKLEKSELIISNYPIDENVLQQYEKRLFIIQVGVVH